MGYLAEWKASVEQRTDVTDAQKQAMMLSKETLEGLHMTGMLPPTIHQVNMSSHTFTILSFSKIFRGGDTLPPGSKDLFLFSERFCIHWKTILDSSGQDVEKMTIQLLTNAYRMPMLYEYRNQVLWIQSEAIVDVKGSLIQWTILMKLHFQRESLGESTSTLSISTNRSTIRHNSNTCSFNLFDSLVLPLLNMAARSGDPIRLE